MWCKITHRWVELFLVIIFLSYFVTHLLFSPSAWWVEAMGNITVNWRMGYLSRAPTICCHTIRWCISRTCGCHWHKPRSYYGKTGAVRTTIWNDSWRWAKYHPRGGDRGCSPAAAGPEGRWAWSCPSTSRNKGCTSTCASLVHSPNSQTVESCCT